MINTKLSYKNGDPEIQSTLNALFIRAQKINDCFSKQALKIKMSRNISLSYSTVIQYILDMLEIGNIIQTDIKNKSTNAYQFLKNGSTLGYQTKEIEFKKTFLKTTIPVLGIYVTTNPENINIWNKLYKNTGTLSEEEIQKLTLCEMIASSSYNIRNEDVIYEILQKKTLTLMLALFEDCSLVFQQYQSVISDSARSQSTICQLIQRFEEDFSELLEYLNIPRSHTESSESFVEIA